MSEEREQRVGLKDEEPVAQETPEAGLGTPVDDDEPRSVPVGPMTAITPQRASDQPVGPVSSGDTRPASRDGAGVDAIWRELGQYRLRLEELQVGFIEEPRETVARTESLVEEAVDRLMNRLRGRLREIHDQAAGQADDTEACRQAMRRYREVLGLFGIQD